MTANEAQIEGTGEKVNLFDYHVKADTILFQYTTPDGRDEVVKFPLTGFCGNYLQFYYDRMPKHVEQLNAVGATKNMKKIRIAIMAVANDMDDIATLYDESAPKIITIFGEIIDWGVKLQQYDLGDNNEQIKAENREALHSLVIAVLTGKNALINGRNELTKIIGIEKHQKRAQRRLTESYTKIIEAFEKCTIKANDMANA